MNKLLVALMVSMISLSSLASTKVHINDGRVRVQQDGITTEYGNVRQVKERNGRVEIYTNKNFNAPAVTIGRHGEITTQRLNNSDPFTCRYDCDFEDE